MRTALRFLLILVILIGGFTEVSDAGQFEIDEWYVTWSINGRGFFIGVEAVAEYIGTLDDASNNWSINTKVDLTPGPYLAGWGKSGTSIPYSGYNVWCVLQNGCAANIDVLIPDCPERICYRGEALVIIWHTGDDEVDYEYLPTEYTPCRCDHDPGPPRIRM